jgi:hypothetical protein
MIFYTIVHKSVLISQGILEDDSSNYFTTDRFLISDYIFVAKSYGKALNYAMKLDWKIEDLYLLKLKVPADEILYQAIDSLNHKGGNISSSILESISIKFGKFY